MKEKVRVVKRMKEIGRMRRCTKRECSLKHSWYHTPGVSVRVLERAGRI
jgi:hypothetical protein